MVAGSSRYELGFFLDDLNYGLFAFALMPAPTEAPYHVGRPTPHAQDSWSCAGISGLARMGAKTVLPG